MIAPWILTAGMLLSAAGGASALAVYNKASQHDVFVVFMPNECTSWSLIPGAFCTEILTINPNSSWSSNNRAGSITIGTVANLLAQEARGDSGGLQFYGSGGRKTFDVDRQGWVEIRPETEAGKLSALVVDVFNQSGQRIDGGRVKISNYY